MSIINQDKIKARLKQIENEFHQLLEPQPSGSSPFDVSMDFENDRFQIHADDREEFYVLLFSRLSHSFEKGFLLEATKGAPDYTWMCSLRFSEGNLSVSDRPIIVEFPISSPGPHKVVRANPGQWNLKTTEWRQMIPQGTEWTALLFEVAPEIRFLFITRLAEPWLQTQTENAHQFLERALTHQP